MTQGRRPPACHHEAGHVLARWWFGFKTDGAKVFSMGQMRSRVAAADWSGGKRSYSEGIVKGPAVSFALGRAALDGLEGNDLARMAGEGVRRAEMALIVCAAGTQAEAAYLGQSAFVCGLAAGGHDRDDAEQIAGAWFEDERQIAEAIETADRVASALVRSVPGSLAIRTMAGALLRRGRITGEDIDFTCSAAYEVSFAEDRWAEAWPPHPAEVRNGFIPLNRTAETSSAPT
jgi:hypothetical protein